jgi:hypothetical protein
VQFAVNVWMASMGEFRGWLEELRSIVDAGPPR